MNQTSISGGSAAIILAAGQGSRMRSDLVKVLHRLAGVEMINHVVSSVRSADFERILVVVGYQGDQVAAALADVEIVVQKDQLGTGHAVDQCRDVLGDFAGSVLVTYGDTPLFRAETFRELTAAHRQSGAAATIVTAHFADPTGYGRILRDDQGRVLGVVEHKDASPTERSITEINTGTYLFQSELLFKYLARITPDNAQTEYYLPDVLPLIIASGEQVEAYVLKDPAESLGINDRRQLAEAEAIFRERACHYWQKQGVTIVDPQTTWIEADCVIGPDTIIFPHCFIQAGTIIGSQARIGPNCRLSAARIGRGAVLESAVVVGETISEGSRLAPFSVLIK